MQDFYINTAVFWY